VTITGINDINIGDNEQIEIYHCQNDTKGPNEISLMDSKCVNIAFSNVTNSSEMSANKNSFEWVADSASTVHVTNRHNAFATYTPVPEIRVTGVGGVQVFAVGKGTVYLSTECDGKHSIIRLQNVLHIPSNQNNLLSVIR